MLYSHEQVTSKKLSISIIQKKTSKITRLIPPHFREEKMLYKNLLNYTDAKLCTVGIWNLTKSGFWMIQKRLGCKWSALSHDLNTYGSDNWMSSIQIISVQWELKSRLIWIFNGQKKVGLKIVWISNRIWNQEAQPFEIITNDCHFVKNHLKSGQKRLDFELLGL